MRVVIGAAVISLVAPACELQQVDTERQQAPIVGGTTAPFDDAVVNLSVGCTGTLVRPNVVLTAAHCLPGGSARFGPDLNSFTASRRVIDTFNARRYGAGLYNGGDIALLLLERDAPAEIAPLPMNFAPLDPASHNGALVRTVGYGNTTFGDGYGVRRQVTHELLKVDGEFIVTGTDSANTCQGDSGGPTFLEIDGVEHVIAVTSFGAEGCLGSSRQTRVDVFKNEFINEVLDAWTGPCKYDGTCVEDCSGFPDPDCQPCGLDGVCSSDCDRKDLDCPFGGVDGDLCSSREDCEGLTCVAAYDEPRVQVCSSECDPERPEDNYGCSQPLSQCLQGEDGGYYCQYGDQTPSTQGASCFNGDDCRSGMCDTGSGGICVELCGDGLPECGADYECGGVGGGVSACLPRQEGGCNAGGGQGPGMALFGLLLALVAARRRKRAA